MLRFLFNLWRLWVSLMSGIASIVLAVYSSWKELVSPTLPYWIASFICLVISAFCLWSEERRKLLLLQMQLDGLTTISIGKRPLRETLKLLGPADTAFLRLMVEYFVLAPEQVKELAARRNISGYDIEKLQRLGLLDWSEEKRHWLVKKSVYETLKEILQGG